MVRNMVLYGVCGVCEVTGIEKKEFNRRLIDYYVLRPIYGSKITIFLPVNNEKLVKRMRRILSPEEVYALIRTMPDETAMWIENETERRTQYKEIISGGDRITLVRLIKALYFHRLEQREIGKKLNVSDEHFMRDAENLLYAEFAHVLDIKKEQVLPFITRLISSPR
jgi:CarD family transcriptional regulator